MLYIIFFLFALIAAASLTKLDVRHVPAEKRNYFNFTVKPEINSTEIMMLGTFRLPCRCTCKCIQQIALPGGSVTSIRNYENPNTAVFERMHKVNAVGAQKYPLLKRRHYILNKIERPVEYKKTIKCILTEEIEGIGLKGSVVEVPKRLFRNRLYVKGQAVYASPENLEFYEEYRKESEEEGIDYEIKQLMKKMSGYHLRVFMNSKEPWTLSPSHLRIAFRKMGIGLGEDNIIMPEEPVAQFGEFIFRVQMNDRIATQVRGIVYPLDENGLPDPDIEYPPVWDNPPVDPSKPVEFLKNKTIDEQTDESVTAESNETDPSDSTESNPSKEK